MIQITSKFLWSIRLINRQSVSFFPIALEVAPTLLDYLGKVGSLDWPEFSKGVYVVNFYQIGQYTPSVVRVSFLVNPEHLHRFQQHQPQSSYRCSAGKHQH
mmetsp:Transcript_10674/g.13364  ORF Transcript_10674/g.13364 Transcript_10674/m.13364 type:complete len:101 (-) Transcript_10674:495-797(-)